MLKLNDTITLCEHCYRHIHGEKFERDGKIWIGKSCPTHGYNEHIIDPDADFYLNYDYKVNLPKGYFIDITNKCNLKCQHCYQVPDNMSKDRTIDTILEQILSWEDDGYGLALAGAEATMRKDLDVLINSVFKLPIKPRRTIVLSNGVRLSDLDYAKKFIKIEKLIWTIGLNHPDYHGSKIRKKQIEGIENCIKLGLIVKDISYTLDNMSQMEYCLEEIQELYKKTSANFRIRCSADIGRNPKEPQIYLSQLVQRTKEIAAKNNWSIIPLENSGIRAHYPFSINGVFVKLIQWPDASTLDLEEIQTESWADVLPGYPISPLVHQIILRDALLNKGLLLPDLIPEKYRRYP